MEITRTAFGAWNGGRFIHYGEALDDERYVALVRRAWERGVRTFVTADVYGAGEADELIGRALEGLPRDEYALVGMVGHDFVQGQREGSKGYPRFTRADLRAPDQYADYLRDAVERSLERCRTGHFDLLMLHNPDRIGYTSPAVWGGMSALRERGLAKRLGIAPGPANGFSLDLIQSFERFGEQIDWAMIILNPFEPWPGRLCLEAARRHSVRLMARVVDYGGIFHDDVRAGHVFARHDHRSFRPAGWVEAAQEKLERIRPIADRHGLTPLQLACAWTLAQPAVECVVPTLIQEIAPGSKAIETKLDELAALPEVRLEPGELELIREVGDNTGCMKLKGASPAHSGEDLPDNWSLDAEALDLARRWGIDPQRDLTFWHQPGPAAAAEARGG